MAVFQWVGGYTGHTGTNSGYSGNFASSGKTVWTSIWNGLTTDRGDFAFAPHHWDFVQNWRERVASSGPLALANQPFDYIPATRLPRGGDQVLFGAPYINNSAVADLFTGGRFEVDRRACGISCLFGGCSGASNTWPGATGAAATGDIEFLVSDDFGWNFLNQGEIIVNPERSNEWWQRLIGVGFARHLIGTFPYSGSIFKRLSIGEIGFDSSKITGDASTQTYIPSEFLVTGFGRVETTNYIAPLHLRFSSFKNRGRRSKVRIRQVSATENTDVAIDGWENLLRAGGNNNQSPIAGESGNDSTLFVCGTVGDIKQDQGFLGSLTYTGDVWLVANNIETKENVGGMHLDGSTVIQSSILCNPKSSYQPISIHCGVGSGSLVTNHDTDQRIGYPGYPSGGTNRPNRLTYRIGSLTGTSVTYAQWRVEPYGPTSQNRFGERTPTVQMHSFIVNNFLGWGGALKTADNADPLTNHVFRDGYLKKDIILDVNKAGDPNFRNGLIGYAPSDEGLRMDSGRARVVFNLGDNVRTNGTGDPSGLT